MVAWYWLVVVGVVGRDWHGDGGDGMSVKSALGRRGRCPRCGGTILLEEGEPFCLMCGWRPTVVASERLPLPRAPAKHDAAFPRQSCRGRYSRLR